MRVKIENASGHIWLHDVPFVILGMIAEGWRKVGDSITEDFADGLILGMMVMGAAIMAVASHV